MKPGMLKCRVWKKGAYFSISGTRSGRCPFHLMKASVLLKGEVRMGVGEVSGEDERSGMDMVSQKTIMTIEKKVERARIGLRHF